jgi:uncharacterized protein YydD (DUF2326 family)
MIYKIYSNDKRFKAVDFSAGLNLILADKKQESGKKDSRNGLGKTTLINIIHFCLGSDLDKQLLPIEKIKDWVFFIELDLNGEKITASRAIYTPNIVKIENSHSKLPIKTERNKKENYNYYRLEEWKRLLGICLFGIENNEKEKNSPTFRSLISYFSRRGADAYIDPFRHFKNQNSCSVQVNNAFFVGLNWRHAAEIEEIKNKSTLIKSLNTAMKTGLVLSQGELEAERVRLEKIILKERKDLSSFRVFPQYQEFQEKANLISRNIHTLLNNNLILQRKLERYEESVRSEHAPEIVTVERLYEEAGLHFGDLLKKTLRDAKKFHSTIIENRKNFLQSEIAEIKNQILSNQMQIENLTQERSELMVILQSHGALEEFIQLQGNLTKKEQKLESIKSKILEIKEMSELRKEIKAKKIELETKLQLDYELSRPNWEKAVVGFNENSQALYDEPGNLIINVSDNGYKFNVEIPRSNSEGIGKMKIFCYDLMLVDIFSRKSMINFLIHDSTIFDGVDSRQIALALEHSHKKALENNFQYICAFNSDMLPYANFSENFHVQDFVRLTLNDQDPKDSLMGFRYNK